MAKYPEWFIGGPLHGKDKADHSPYHPDWQPMEVREMEVHQTPEGPDYVTKSHIYHRRLFYIGAITFPVWVVDRPGEIVLATQIAELIMAPHAKGSDE